MPDPVTATITADQLARLTGFSVSELITLARKGYFPKAKDGSYEQAKTLVGCFKAYRDKLQQADGLPVYESMAQCEAQAHIPRAVLKQARKECAEAFRAHRIKLGELLKWLFSKNGGDENWGEHLKKFQALREEIRWQKDNDQSIGKPEVTFALGKIMALLFSGLDKASDQLPSILHGQEAAVIKEKLTQSNAGLKLETGNALRELLKQ